MRLTLCLLAILLRTSQAILAAENTNVQFKVEATLKETFDSNIYLQDVGPDDANVAAAKAAGLEAVEAKQSSWVTAILPKLGLEYRGLAALHIRASYAPDLSFYHSARNEDYVAHRGLLTLGGKVANTTWELLNTATYVDGRDEGPVFARPGDVPAVGGIPIRDRREAFVFKNSFRLTQPLGNWFIRPVASAYVHDFGTVLRYVPPPLRSSYVYENYIDRQEVSGGVDVGWKAFQRAHWVMGYRYGRQEQFEGPSGAGGQLIDSPFDSSFHRVLVGVEGTLTDWLKVNLAVGPDFRDFSSRAEEMFPAFESDHGFYYWDGSVTIQASAADTIALKATRFAQPAFSSFSIYNDIKTDLVWRHRFDSRCSASLGFTLYIGDWQPPARRKDWIYTPSASLSYDLTSKLAAELAYSYDWVDSRVSRESEPLTKAHEFTRHLATLGLTWAF